MAGFNGSRNVLAQCVPALARASQLLCTVTQPGQARDALQQAVGLLDGNGRFAELTAVKELADRCRVMAQTGAEGELVAACRQLGVTLARQMTTLTQEIQQQAKAPARPVAPATPVAPAPIEPPKPVAEVAKPVEAPKPVEKPAPVEKAKPVEKVKPAPKPQVAPGLVERITVARTPAEKSAVTLALQEGRRFAVVGNGTIIDTKANRMWAARPSPATPHSGAQSYAQNLRLANYADWRLPAPEELQQLVAEGGSGPARSLGMFTAERGGSVDWLWTSQSRKRFWIFGLEAVCLSLRTGLLSHQKAGAAGAAPLLVRSAA